LYAFSHCIGINGVWNANNYFQAHSPTAQNCIAAAGVPYGVQFEIARLVSLKRLEYEDISSTILLTLQGLNAQAAPETARKFVEAGTSVDHVQDPAFAREAAAKVCIKFYDSFSKLTDSRLVTLGTIGYRRVGAV
jgi:hypothetical protein